MNRHAPHSHIAPDPKTHKPCDGCGKPISLRPQFPKHECDDKCENGIHNYAGEITKPHVRYFDEQFKEFCEECVKRRYGAGQLVHRGGSE